MLCAGKPERQVCDETGPQDPVDHERRCVILLGACTQLPEAQLVGEKLLERETALRRVPAVGELLE